MWCVRPPSLLLWHLMWILRGCLHETCMHGCSTSTDQARIALLVKIRVWGSHLLWKWPLFGLKEEKTFRVKPGWAQILTDSMTHGMLFVHTYVYYTLLEDISACFISKHLDLKWKAHFYQHPTCWCRHKNAFMHVLPVKLIVVSANSLYYNCQKNGEVYHLYADMW